MAHVSLKSIVMNSALNFFLLVLLRFSDQSVMEAPGSLHGKKDIVVKG